MLPVNPQIPPDFDWPIVRRAFLNWFARLSSYAGDSPPGLIGETLSVDAPPGWLLADGMEYDATKYPDLFKAQGSVESSPGKFTVPNIIAPSPSGAGQAWIIKI